MCHQIALRHRKLTSHMLSFMVAIRIEAQATCMSNRKQVKHINEMENDVCDRQRTSEELTFESLKREKISRDDNRRECIDEVVDISLDETFNQVVDLLCSNVASDVDRCHD